MIIRSIGNYTIFHEPNKFKQVYSNKNHRLLQITDKKVHYIDTHLMKEIKKFVKVLRQVK